MHYNATLMYKTQNMQSKEQHIMGESTCPSKFKIIDVSKVYYIASIQYLIYHLRKI